MPPTPIPRDPAAAPPAPETEPTLVDVVDRLLDRGVVIRGDLWLTVADVELAYVGAQLVVASPEAMRRAEAAA